MCELLASYPDIMTLAAELSLENIDAKLLVVPIDVVCEAVQAVVVVVLVVEMPGGVCKGCSIHGSCMVTSGKF